MHEAPCGLGRSGDAADEQPGLSDRRYPLPQPRVSHHHLPDRSAQASRTRPGTAPGARTSSEVRVHSSMPGLDWLRQLHGKRQSIPVSFRGRKGSYSHCMFLNDHPPIAGGRELWGFPNEACKFHAHTEIDTLVGTLDYGPIRVATGTMGYKHRAADLSSVKASLSEPNYLLKIIPTVDGSLRICELVEYHLEDVDLKGAWTGPDP